MTIDNVTDTTPRIQYVAAAAQTDFDYSFPIFEDTDLVVDVDGTTKSQGTDYTVTGAGSDTGGTVSFTAAMSGGEIVTLYRDTDISRSSQYQQNGPFSSQAFNDDLNKLTTVAQENKARTLRALRIPVTAEVTDDDISLNPANFGGKYLTFDSSGKPVPAALSSETMTRDVVGNLLYPRTSAEIATGVTPVNYAYEPGDVRRYGADPTGVSDSATAIANADAVANQSNGLVTVYIPAGTYKCAAGITKKPRGNWRGDGKYLTILQYTGSGVFINAVGTSVSAATRVICTISDMRFDGTNASAPAECFNFGWNQRSNPLLARVHVYNWPHYGIHFTDQEWNIDFVDVEVDTCGNTTTNSAGVFKDASIDGGTFNAVTFTRCQVEACGTSTSTAGGINMQTTTSNRGLNLVDCVVEGNFGALQILVSNMAATRLAGLYMEGVTATGQTHFVELDGCTGSITGGFLSGSGATATKGLLLKASSEFDLSGMQFSSWSTAGLDVQSSIVRTGHNPGITFTLDSAAQSSGEIAPRVIADKGGTDQTGIASATPTKVTYTNVTTDKTSAMASSKFTPQTIGVYRIQANVKWNACVDQTRLETLVYFNGAGVRSNTVQASGTGAQSCPIDVQIETSATTDYIEIYARQDSGSTQVISGVTDETWFMASLVERE